MSSENPNARYDKPIEFNDLIEVPVTFKGEEYVLREATAEASAAYVSAKTKTLRFDSSGNFSSFGNVGDLPLLLVSMCLFRVGESKPVPKSEIKKFGTRIVLRLYERALDISGLDEDNTSMFDQFQKALAHDESPISYEDLQEFARKLDVDEFRMFRAVFKVKPEAEEAAKNS